MGVMLIASWYLGRSFRSNVVAFSIGSLFLLTLYALGVNKAATWAMVVIVAIIVLGVISTALN